MLVDCLPNNGRTRSIVAQFHHHQDRTDVLKAASSIKKSHSNIIITEDFPAAVQKNRRVLLPVFHAAKDRFKGQNTNVSLRGDILTIGNTKYGIKDISNGRTRSIVAQFHHHQDRTDVLKAASSIKKSHSNIIITEDFPAAVQKNRRVLLPVFHAAKDRFKGQNTNVSLRGDILTIGNTKYGIKDISKLPANLSPHNACTAQNEDTVAFFFHELKIFKPPSMQFCL